MFEIKAREKGVLAGIEELRKAAEELGIELRWIGREGTRLEVGSKVLEGVGSAWQVARAEEELVGIIGKPSGVATEAAEMVALAGERARIVCGAWKKVPRDIRPLLRRAIAVGGAGIRLLDNEPFIYLDKNYVRMFGSIREAVLSARQIPGRVIAVQIRGETGPLTEEVREAAYSGAGIIMVDTGQVQDLVLAEDYLRTNELRHAVRLAFGGSVSRVRVREVVEAGAEIIDVGRAIIDAPLLDFSLDVIARLPE
ncbi:MAG: nicotinate-nucleotide pyrophosphorylase [Bacillota bacterium]